MKYEIDREVKEIIIQLCDVALKAGGLQNKQAVDMVLKMLSEEIIPEGEGDK